ncbi:hypothetical protein NM688_g5368 [Phlebia brevispora]|uniref:Uncharacterized protein n=1 Tax=Phlebia brevispora TaxID=194682 RepID=A0ACC1SX42_9APHY|nr:hypothetical protein NM688_g5368 [Phlebia brevispora]
MAYPYATYTTPYLWPYYQQPVITPFIPAHVSLPPSPNAGSGSKHVRFDNEQRDAYHTDRRERPPSWHAGTNGSAAYSYSAPTSAPFLYTALPPTMPYGVATPGTHRRRLSESALPQAAWGMHPGWMLYSPTAPTPRPTFNPLINGEALGGALLLFDLSSNIFEPLRISNHSSIRGSQLTREELMQTATYPSVTRMVITCDELPPEWKVTLEPCDDRPSNNGYLNVPSVNASSPDAPITVYDVLYAVHSMLQRQITQREWYDTPQHRATAIARAYTRRCRAGPNIQAFEESQGVRRVDFLLDQYMFKGIVRERGEQGFEYVRLRVGKK